MLLVFWLTFDVIGAVLSDLLALGIETLSGIVDRRALGLRAQPGGAEPVIDGVFLRCGQRALLPADHRRAVLLSLHSGGYRLHGPRGLCDGQPAAQDRPFRAQHRADAHRFRLHGARRDGARTLSSERDRKMTILLTPFMSCSAKIPIYAIITAAFFPHRGALVMVCLYGGGVWRASCPPS
jgi:ferrous iron transport protein B